MHARMVTLLYNQHSKRVGIGLARTPHPLEIFRPGQTELSLHPLLETHLFTSEPFLRVRWLELSVYDGRVDGGV